MQVLSRGIAEQRKNHDYYIAHSSLADIESGKLATDIYKLYSLSVIYGRQYEKLATFFDVPVGEAEKDPQGIGFPTEVSRASELGDSSITKLGPDTHCRTFPTDTCFSSLPMADPCQY